jgi:hypothetical protein
MATPLPAGWRQRSTSENEYEAILDLGNFNKYEINVNVQTGQRQIYSIDAVLKTREFVGTVNADGTTVRQEAWTNIAALPNGQTRLKEIIDASRTAANKIVGSVGTEEQKRRLAEQKEYSKLKSGQEPPASPGGGSSDTGGANAGGDNAAAGQSLDGGTPPEPMAPLRNVSSFQTEEDKYGNWKYPESLNTGQDYMIISTYNYQVADVFGGSDGISNISSGLIFDGANLSKRTLKNDLGSVTLPMPSTISEANQTGWGEDSLNNLAAGLMSGAVGMVGNITDGNLIGGIGDVVQTAKNVFNSAGAKAQIRQQLTLNAAASVVKKLGININTEGYRARVTGTVINPNLELLFNGPKLRAFQFSYKLAPRSAKEAKQIRGIIKFFKKAMAPKRAKTGGSGDEFFLGAPNIFRVKFMNGSKESNTLPTLKTCALVNFNVNYTADGFYSAYVDGQPVSVQIDLAFAELTPIYNDNYGSDDSVGFLGGTSGLDNLENPLFDPRDVSEQQNEADNAETPRTQDPRTPGAGTSPGSPVPAVILGTEATVGSPNNPPPLAGSPGSLALPAN